MRLPSASSLQPRAGSVMKVPLAWLKEYVAVRLSPEVLAERLTMAGLEVTGIEDVGGQPVLNIEVTPNRSDCLSIIGVAREVAAITGQRLKLSAGHGTRDTGQADISRPQGSRHSDTRCSARRGLRRAPPAP